MADAFLQLSVEDRREALSVAADRSGRPAHLLEKDVWVVWALATLYGSPLGENLVFKGGTSLSKAYQVIRRFSEDVDLTYDIRALAPDLVGDNGEALPKTRSEEKRWTSEVRKRLPVSARCGGPEPRAACRRAWRGPALCLGGPCCGNRHASDTRFRAV
jgi:hypothetical protein